MFVIRAVDLKKTLWKNGSGFSSLVIAHPHGSSVTGFDWRVSVAEINSDGEFSQFPSCDRALVLLNPGGVILNGEKIEPLTIVRFPGEITSRAELTGEFARDFGVIWKRDLYKVDISIVGSSEHAKVEKHLSELRETDPRGARLIFQMSTGDTFVSESKPDDEENRDAQSRFSSSSVSTLILVSIRPA